MRSAIANVIRIFNLTKKYVEKHIVFSPKERKIIYKTEVVAEERRADGNYWIETPPMRMTWRLKAIEEYTGEKLDESVLKLHGFKGGKSLQL